MCALITGRVVLSPRHGGLGYGSVVANTYAANFGDVVKHAVLCEVIVRERPRRYLESHGGRLDYESGSSFARLHAPN